VINKKTLKAILSFTENQKPAPSFIVIYILTWIVWHNQVFTAFFSVQGDFFTRIDAALLSLEKNQYLVVFLITCLIFLLRLGYGYLTFKSRELLNSSDDTFINAREDQIFEKNDDISNLMSALTKAKEQLAASKDREAKLAEEKNTAIKKLLALQHQLDEAKADIAMLTKSTVDN
jgi:hypothetical protein